MRECGGHGEAPESDFAGQRLESPPGRRQTMPTPEMTPRGKLERSLRRLQVLNRLLNSPKVSEKAKTRLRSAKNLQQTAIKLRRKALIRIRWSGEPH